MTVWQWIKLHGDDFLTCLALIAVAEQDDKSLSPQVIQWITRLSIWGAVIHKVFFPNQSALPIPKP